MLRRFGAAELGEFLRALDRHLNRNATAIIIGGTAIALRYATTHATSDIDLASADREVLEAARAASAETGLEIPVAPAGIFSAPYSYEDRCEPLELPGLTHLRPFVPERHDLAVMKLARGATHDLEAVEDIHRTEPLTRSVLIERFRETEVIGSPEMFRLSLLAAIARLWGDDVAADTERDI